MVTLVLGHQDQLTNAVKHHLRETHRKTHTVGQKQQLKPALWMLSGLGPAVCLQRALYSFFFKIFAGFVCSSLLNELCCVYSGPLVNRSNCVIHAQQCAVRILEDCRRTPPPHNVHGQTHLKPACPPAVPLKFSRGASIGSVPTDSHSFPAELTMFNKI